MKFAAPERKIAFICPPQLTTFIEPICDYIIRETDIRIRRVWAADPETVNTALRWADVVWFEWANELTIAATRNSPQLLTGKDVIVRCHSYEALAGMLSQIGWQVVQKVVFVAEHMQSLGRTMIPDHIESVVIPNGLDPDKFPLCSEKVKGSVAHLGHISAKKGPMLLMHAFYYLLCQGEDLTLHLGGDFQDPRFQFYVEDFVMKNELQHRVKFDGKIEDVSGWLQDKQYIICSSPWESQNLAVMEGMLSGCIPLVHSFPGADRIYKEEWCWKTLEDLHHLLIVGGVDIEIYRQFIIDNYSFKDTTKKVLELLGV